MKIGKHTEIRKVNKDDFVILAEQLGLKAKTIFDTYFEIFEKVENTFEIIEADFSLKNHGVIIDRIEQNISKRKLS